MKILTLLSIVVAALLFTMGVKAQPITGVTSYYHPSLNGNLTANGERYNHHTLTAAHRNLPFGTKVRVTDLTTNKSVVVRINDRGPFVKGRVLDLSGAAVSSLGIKKRGIAKVQITVLNKPRKPETYHQLARVKKQPKPIEPILVQPLDSIEALITMFGEDKTTDKLTAMSL